MEVMSMHRHSSGVTIVEEVKPTVTMMPPAPRPAPSSARRCKQKSTTSGRRTSSSSWVGIRPVERQLMRPWLTKKIDDGQIPGLEWVDASKTKFRIPWKHGSRQGWKHDQDACLFMHWAQHTGRFQKDEPPNPKRWKANFRCAINSLPDVREVKEASQTRGQNAFRIYEFMAERKPRQTAAAGNSSKRKAIEASTPQPARPMSVSLPSPPTTTTGAGLMSQSRPRSLPVPLTAASTSAVNTAPASPLTANLSSTKQDCVANGTSSSSCSPVSSPCRSPTSPMCPTPPHDVSNHSATPSIPYNIFTEWQLHADNQGYRPTGPEAASTTVPTAPAFRWAPHIGNSQSPTPAAPAFSPAPNTTHSVNKTIKNNHMPMSTATSQVFPVSASPAYINSSTFPTVTSQTTSSPFPARSAQMPQMTLDLAVTSHLDYDSGIGSPSSLGSGQHCDMDCFTDEFSDSNSDISVELSHNDISEVFKYLNNTQEEQMSFTQGQYSPETQPPMVVPQWQQRRADGSLDSHESNQNCLSGLDDVECMLDIMYSITVKGPLNNQAASTIDATVSARLNDLKSG